MNALRVDGLSFAHPGGRVALSGLSFTIEDGERVGLIGPNGAGKSTLLLHLNGLLPEKPGDAPAVEVHGAPLLSRNLELARREVGLLFQSPDDQLFCPTLLDDVAFGPRQLGLPDGALHELASRCLAQVGLAGYEERAPHQLSQGEKRRAAIAGLLACEPRVLLLDEPTNDLDPRGRRELIALLRELSVTMVIASHDLELIASLCPRVLLLDGGRLIADGPAREHLRNEELMLAHGLESPRPREWAQSEVASARE